MTIVAKDGSAPRDARLMLLMLGIAAVGVQALMLSPLLTDIAATLHAGAREIGFASAAYGIGVALAALSAAPRLGAWEKRNALRLAFLVMAVGLSICALSWDWRVLVVGQAVTGLAAGVIIPGTYAFTAEISPADRRSQAIGRVLFGWSVAMVGGVPLAALLSAWIDWRGIFLSVGGLSFAMALVIGLLPRGSVVPSVQSTSYRTALSVPGALMGLAATFCYMIGFYQTYTFIGDHVRAVHGAGAWLGGLISLAYGIGFGAGVIFDKWIDRTGPGRVMAGALFLVGLNYAVLPLAVSHVWTTATYPFFWGLANHLCMTSLVAYLGQAPVEKRGTIMGLFSFITYVAVGVGGATYGTVYDHFGFVAVSLAATATLWVGAIAVLLFRPRQPLG
ncbi:MAG: MFS transporter [Rhizobiales bacterium]|nr:MFS transporter [Hyphomicrobiales bacterium]